MKKQNSPSDFVTQIFLDVKLDELKQKIDEKARSYRDDILNKLDEVMGELETMRDENLVGGFQIKELRENQANHERRIRDIEKHVQKAA